MSVYIRGAIEKNIINRWLKDLFDSKSGGATANIPFWDAANSAIVSAGDSDGILSDERFTFVGDESASAWFIP